MTAADGHRPSMDEAVATERSPSAINSATQPSPQTLPMCPIGQNSGAHYIALVRRGLETTQPQQSGTDQTGWSPQQTVEGDPSPGSMPAWRLIAVGACAVGGPAAIGLIHPTTGEVLAVTEAAMLLIVFIAALFGSQTISDRAFRLLRWMRNRPEPTAPPHDAPREP